MEIIGWIFAFVVAITVHEAAHAWAANRLGDPTAKRMGRLSLNPIVHYDPVGTTMLLVLVAMRAFGANVMPFGWAKPVQFNPNNLENPRRDSALISLAGPASNLLLSILLAVILRLSIETGLLLNIIPAISIPIILLNVSLAVFNLLPIHPLDGGKIFIALLPERDAREADMFLHRYGMLILFFLIFPIFRGVSPLFAFINPVIDFLLKLLIPLI